VQHPIDQTHSTAHRQPQKEPQQKPLAAERNNQDGQSKDELKPRALPSHVPVLRARSAAAVECSDADTSLAAATLEGASATTGP
jgi:hypothetical protein